MPASIKGIVKQSGKKNVSKSIKNKTRRIEKNNSQRTSSIVIPYCPKQNKKIRAERNSTNGYLILILALQK
tara:strand:- start:340 stop:552 length:213 start_codon:yes stop_codon:yes gene_type:complete